MPCIMPEQPYCPACHYGYIVYDENDDTHCEWNCLLTEEEYKSMSKKTDPLFELFNYACDKMYRVIYTFEGYDERIVRGLLINCHGSLVVLLGEKGLYYIKHKNIQLMEPIPMPKNLSDNFRKVIETYLKERAEDAAC